MTIWLNPDQVAERLGVARRTAMALMNDMPHSVISGTQRKRIRVSENNLDEWVSKQSNMVASVKISTATGSKRRLERR